MNEGRTAGCLAHAQRGRPTTLGGSTKIAPIECRDSIPYTKALSGSTLWGGLSVNSVTALGVLRAIFGPSRDISGLLQSGKRRTDAYHRSGGHQATNGKKPRPDICGGDTDEASLHNSLEEL